MSARPLRLIPAEPEPATETVAGLVRRACDLFLVDRAVLLSRSRKRRHVKARTWVALQLHARGWTLEEIGEVFDRDHSTVSYWLGRAKR